MPSAECKRPPWSRRVNVLLNSRGEPPRSQFLFVDHQDGVFYLLADRLPRESEFNGSGAQSGRRHDDAPSKLSETALVQVANKLESVCVSPVRISLTVERNEKDLAFGAQHLGHGSRIARAEGNRLTFVDDETQFTQTFEQTTAKPLPPRSNSDDLMNRSDPNLRLRTGLNLSGSARR